MSASVVEAELTEYPEQGGKRKAAGVLVVEKETDVRGFVKESQEHRI